MIYILMHEDKKLALFKYENQRVESVVINEKLKNKLPIMKLSSKNIEDKVADWLINRGIPITRQGIKSELVAMGKKSTVDYMLDNMGLSLSDHYWICPQNSNCNWKTINLYENDFKNRYSLNLKDDMKDITGKTEFVPSASLKGDLKKKWIIDNNGVRRLVKGNYNNTCRQSLCEVLATEIHKRQGIFPYTPYSLIKIGDKGQEIIGCECPNFTDIKTEFIPAIDIVDSMKKPNDSNYYELYIKYCIDHGINEGYMRNFMEYQILTDFIITNTDRHLNNFGVIRDSETFKLLRPAPIFDTGNSMFYNTNNIKVDYGLLNIRVTSFKKYEIELLKYVTNPLLVDINKLPSTDEVYNLFKIDTSVTEETIIKLVRAYKKKVELLYELQCGVKIYSYNYLKDHKVKLDKD